MVSDIDCKQAHRELYYRWLDNSVMEIKKATPIPLMSNHLNWNLSKQYLQQFRCGYGTKMTNANPGYNISSIFLTRMYTYDWIQLRIPKHQSFLWFKMLETVPKSQSIGGLEISSGILNDTFKRKFKIPKAKYFSS